jgi:cytoskeleton protein RodZ
MESIGDKLRGARERDNLTLDQVSRETHVAKRFLKALEDEDFSVFPGETYALGFLRNYADFLGLDAEELVSGYRSLKIQEQPIPMTELLEPRRKARLLPIVLIAAAAAVVLGVGGWLLYRKLTSKAAESPRAAAEEKSPKASSSAEEFVFLDEVRTRWFKQGDVIIVPAGQKTWRIEVLSIADNLTLRIPGGSEVLGLGKERLIDLNGDQNAEIKIVWNDRDTTSKEKRVNLGLFKTTGSPSASVPEPAGSTAAPTAPAVAPIRKSAFKPVTLTRTTTETRFVADFVFLNYCFFRYQADGKDREERFFQKGEAFSLDAKEAMTLWFSNAGAVKVRLDGKDVELGGSGEVAVRRILQRKDGGASQLEVSALY